MMKQRWNLAKMRPKTTWKVKVPMWQKQNKFQKSRLKSCRLPSTDSTKRQISRQQRNRSRRHQSMRRRNERNGETDLQRNRKAKWIYSWGMAKSESKSDTQKKVTLKMLETIARSALCLRCTDCSRQYCTAGYIQYLTKVKRSNGANPGGLPKNSKKVNKRGLWSNGATCCLQIFGEKIRRMAFTNSFYSLQIDRSQLTAVYCNRRCV